MYLLAIIFGYSVTVLNLQILHTRMEAKNMRSNRIWNRVAGFMQQLRCESLSQKNMVQMPEQQRIKKELEKNNTKNQNTHPTQPKNKKNKKNKQKLLKRSCLYITMRISSSISIRCLPESHSISTRKILNTLAVSSIRSSLYKLSGLAVM